MTARRRSSILAVAGLPVLAAAACGGDAEDPTARRTVTVFAAASLTESFEQIGRDFPAAHPGTTVRFNFGASSALAQQIVQGAPADVFAAASPTLMQQVVDANLVTARPATFVRNRLQIAVPRGNPGGVRGLADFATDELKIALCAPQVPCGAAAGKAFAAAGVVARPDTLEQDVKATLSKVRLGEVDAALVYRTDVLAAGGEVEGLDVPEATQAVNDYPVAVLARAADAGDARTFVDHLLSERGRAVLAGAGFDRP
ncbi:MAG: molybdate ABC transporter substrate-binding protein [Actinomycetota bacterium]|nr:molybdate ABC transporter substrate-binding protein [Actinomycetota bacterium]